jgi:chromosome segregation ATPase
MPPTTETDLKELRDLLTANHAAVTQQIAATNQQIATLSQRVEIGFAQVDTKFAGVDTKLAEMNGTIQALDQKVSGDIKAIDQKVSSDIKALDQKVSGDIKALDQKVTGIDDRLKSQDNKLTQIDANQRELTIQFTEMKGELKIVRQPIEFWEFVKRAVVSGLTVTVVGGLLLAGWKLVIFGTI